MADFMGFVESNLAKEGGKLAQWKEKFWGRRYEAIVVSDEEPAQIERLKYVLSNGCKEGLVARPQDWTGASTTTALLTGTMTLIGHWFDRTKEYRARQAGNPALYPSTETVTLSPLPCWTHLDDSEIKQRVTRLVQEIEDETTKMYQKDQTSPLGMDQVLRQDPHSRPKPLKRSPTPLFHAASRKVRQQLLEAYSTFLESYRIAAGRFKEGDFNVRFPTGSFLPPGPYRHAAAFG
jgi:hypothetical protein